MGHMQNTILWGFYQEILSIAIRHNDDIRGINMFGKKVKNTMFADDCTVIIDGSEQSYNTAVFLFEEFGKLSGLNLNFSKCIPLKIVFLRNEHDLIYSKKKEILSNEETKNKFNVFLYRRDRLLSYIYMFAKFYIYQCKF